MVTTPEPLAPGADRAAILSYCRARFAQALVDAVSRCGIRLPGLLNVLSQGAQRAFDELAGLRSREEFVRLRSLTASRISLVHPEDMDLTVALINLAHTLSDACEGRLPRLHLLFMTLLDQDTSVVDQLPVGPDGVCTALRELCDADEMAPELRLDIPSRVEEALAHALNELYRDLTETLSNAGVTPKSLVRSAQESGGQPRNEGGGLGSVRDSREAPSGPALPSGPLGRLQHSVLRKRGGTESGGGSGGGGGGMTDPALLQAILDQVTRWLTERQTEAARQPYGANTAQVNLGEIAGLLPAQSNAALEALNLSFDALLIDRTICLAIKPSLGRLRLPVCKAALLDPSFLAEAGHPARRLLDSALRLGASLRPEEAPTHPVCQAIEAVACQVQRDFTDDIQCFAEAALRLETLEATRLQDAQARADRLTAIAEREARREQARSRAARAIRALCAVEPPAAVQIFLERLWVRVLAHIHQTAGEKSPEWVQALTTANLLIDSVQPKTDAESRRALLGALPDLLNALRAGMEAIATPEVLRERAFQSFVALHSAAMRGKAPESTAGQDVLPPPLPPRIDSPAELPHFLIVRLSPDGEPDRDLPEWVAQIQDGDWLQITLPERGVQRLRVGWSGGMPRMLLLTRPDEELVVLLPLRWLAVKAADQTAEPVPMGALFERAVETAIRLAQGYA